jgi:hypothetical protein
VKVCSLKQQVYRCVEVPPKTLGTHAEQVALISSSSFATGDNHRDPGLVQQSSWHKTGPSIMQCSTVGRRSISQGSMGCARYAWHCKTPRAEGAGHILLIGSAACTSCTLQGVPSGHDGVHALHHRQFVSSNNCDCDCCTGNWLRCYFVLVILAPCSDALLYCNTCVVA